MTTVLNQIREHGTWSPFGKKGDDQFTINIPSGEVFDSCYLTILESRLSAGARITVQPTAGQAGSSQVVVRWWYDGGSQVKYRIEATSRNPSTAPGRTVTVPGFLPSTKGFHFRNSFPPRPDLVLNTPFGNIAIGDASKGLCGGMVYAVRDYFEAAMPIPQVTAPPDGGPLFDFIVNRLFDSFDLPGGVLKYLELMNPALPDHETEMSKLGLAPRGRAWRMIREEWPKIKADLDAGRLCPLGLVCVKSADFTKLGDNHQVLAYGYNLNGDQLSLHIYDPNKDEKDDVRLQINLSNPEHTTQVIYPGKTVYSFFRTNYNFEAPPQYEGSLEMKVAIRAVVNNKLICAENGGAQPLIANRDNVGPWETFSLKILGNNRIALKSAANNKYVCAENAGSQPLIANRDQIGPWETFEIVHKDSNNCALKSLANRKYVCAENSGSQPLKANRDQVGLWETFTITMI